jgi:hypothetical protein
MDSMFSMIAELANAISPQNRKIKKFDIPKNALSSTRYERKNSVSEKAYKLGANGRFP